MPYAQAKSSSDRQAAMATTATAADAMAAVLQFSRQRSVMEKQRTFVPALQQPLTQLELQTPIATLVGDALSLWLKRTAALLQSLQQQQRQQLRLDHDGSSSDNAHNVANAAADTDSALRSLLSCSSDLQRAVVVLQEHQSVQQQINDIQRELLDTNNSINSYLTELHDVEERLYVCCDEASAISSNHSSSSVDLQNVLLHAERLSHMSTHASVFLASPLQPTARLPAPQDTQFSVSMLRQQSTVEELQQLIVAHEIDLALAEEKATTAAIAAAGQQEAAIDDEQPSDSDREADASDAAEAMAAAAAAKVAAKAASAAAVATAAAARKASAAMPRKERVVVDLGFDFSDGEASSSNNSSSDEGSDSDSDKEMTD